MHAKPLLAAPRADPVPRYAPIPHRHPAKTAGGGGAKLTSATLQIENVRGPRFLPRMRGRVDRAAKLRGGGGMPHHRFRISLSSLFLSP